MQYRKKKERNKTSSFHVLLNKDDAADKKQENPGFKCILGLPKEERSSNLLILRDRTTTLQLYYDTSIYSR
jgi:hypothetical protein